MFATTNCCALVRRMFEHSACTASSPKFRMLVSPACLRWTEISGQSFCNVVVQGIIEDLCDLFHEVAWTTVRRHAQRALCLSRRGAGCDGEHCCMLCLEDSLFFLKTDWEGKPVTNLRKPTENAQLCRPPRCAHKKASLNTSCVEGTAPMRGTGRVSRRDSAKALVALHASRELQRRNHAAFTLPWRRGGTESARALANPRRNWAVSSDHLPPTSAARTTRRARPASPASSG